MYSPLLIFTDLDGTLLDHHTYSFKGAEDALLRLHQLAIPLVLTSSKTRAEIQRLQEELGISEAFITENGGGVFLPPGHPMHDAETLQQLGPFRGMQFGRPYTEIRRIFEEFRDDYKLRGFGDMSAEELMGHTGLGRAEALLAARRDFSEPFLFLTEPRLHELEEDVSGHGLQITRGGRFYHMLSAAQDKGRAVAVTTSLFQAACPEKIVTVGLGDAENDFVMLNAVDIPVLIPKPDGSYESMELHGLRKAPYPGSTGWGAAVMAILDDFQIIRLHT